MKRKQPENINQLFKTIDWQRMAKGRFKVKKLAKDDPSLKYIAEFLEILADVAVDGHNLKMSDVYPSSTNAVLIYKEKQHLN